MFVIKTVVKILELVSLLENVTVTFSCGVAKPMYVSHPSFSKPLNLKQFYRLAVFTIKNAVKLAGNNSS